MPESMCDDYNIKLQTILHPTEELCDEEQVYYHRQEDGLTIDYDGYFNLFYIEKRHKYTDITELKLILELQGYESVTLMHDRDELNTYDLKTPGELTSYEFSFPYSDYDKGVFWFRLRRLANGTGDNEAVETIVEGSYIGTVAKKNPVKMFVDICTYKREKYVLRNMSRLTAFFGKKENHYIRDNIHIGLIDNGRTLKDNHEISALITENPYIEIIENRNTGGAGGFTKGMQEALARKDEEHYSHVLLMDDDATYEPDMFVRLFGVLSTLNSGYSDATIGGAIWREDYPFIQYASGEWFEKLKVINKMPNLDMRQYDECVQEEMCSTLHEFDRYSGWWCCCYSLNVVREDNLPLPLFVHRDDIEYEKRNRLKNNPIIFISGIGVWHKSFDSEYPGIKLYYDYRNTLLMTALHEPDILKRYIKKEIRKELTGLCLNQRYHEMKLVYMGAMDFCRGFKWILNLDSEKYNSKLSEYYNSIVKYVPLEDIDVVNKEDILNKAGTFGEKMSLERVLYYQIERHYKLPLIKKISLNGILLPHKKGAAFITPDNGIWENNYRYAQIVFYVPSNGKAMLQHFDFRQLFVTLIMYLRFAYSLNRMDLTSYGEEQ